MTKADRVTTLIFSLVLFITTTSLYNFYYSRHESKVLSLHNILIVRSLYSSEILDWHSTTLYIICLMLNLKTTTGEYKMIQTYNLTPCIQAVDNFFIPFVYSLFYTMCSIALYILLCVILSFMDSKSKLFWYFEKVFIILSLLFICISSYLFLKSQFVDIDEYDF